MTTVIKNITPTFLEYKLKKDSSDLVSVLYEVTRADTPMLDGDSYTWDSLLVACEAAQQDIKDGAMFGFLEHQPSVYVKNSKKPVGTYQDKNKRLFKVDSMWPDYENRRILSWADYLDNPLAREESRKIREDGFKPAVSMTSFVSCSKKVCNVAEILNYDQVASPNMESAVMLSFNSSQAVEDKFLEQIDTELRADSCCDNCANHTGNCLSKQSTDETNSKNILPEIFGQILAEVKSSRSGPTKFNQNSRLGEQFIMFNSKYFQGLKKDNGILSLDAIYGMALGGWITQQGITSLAYWVDMFKDLTAKSSTMAASAAADDTTESTMMATDSALLGKQIVAINKAYHENRKDKEVSLEDLLKVKADSNEPEAKADSKILEAMSVISAEVKALSSQVTTLTQDAARPRNDAPPVQPNPKEEIQKHIDEMLAKDSVTFQDGKVVYQKNSFEAKDINTIRENALRADSKEGAVSILEFGFEALHKNKAKSFLENKGFNMAKDADAPAAGATRALTVPSKQHEQRDLLRNSYMDTVRISNPDLHARITFNKDSKAYQDRVKPIRDFIEGSIKDQLKVAEDYSSSGALKADSFSQVDFNKLFNGLLAWLPTEANKDEFAIKKDSSDQALVNAAIFMILPYISTAIQHEPVEQLDLILDFYAGLGLESLDVSASFTSPGFGAVFNFEQDFAAIATGNNDDPDNLELTDDGESLFEEISSKTSRFEFVSKFYGGVLRLSREHIWNLSQWNGTDLFAREQFRMLEKMMRDQQTRALRELYRVAGDVNAVERTDTVANVAPTSQTVPPTGAEAPGLYAYKGEYKKRSGADVPIVIGGKVFGGVGSNIDAVIRVKGGFTSNTVFRNVPIACFRTKKTRTVKGAPSTEILNPMTVIVNSVDITARQGLITKLASGVTTISNKKGATLAALWAVDEDGFVVLSSAETGHGTDPTSPAISVSYSEVTNAIWQNVDQDVTDPQTFWSQYIYNLANANSEMASAPNYAAGDMVLHSKVMGTQIRQAGLFRKDNSPTGATLPILSLQNKIVGIYDDLTHVATNATLPFGDSRSLILKKDYAKFNMSMQPMSTLYKAQQADLSTGKIKTKDAVCSDVMMQETFAIPVLTIPDTDPPQVTGFPFKQVIHYGVLKFRQSA